MKLNNIELQFDDFAAEMAKLKNEKHFDYLVTIIGEDFGEEGLGCIYILENTKSHERASVKALTASREDAFLPTISHLWKAAEMLEREVFDFLGIKFLGHPDMRRLFLRSDFVGYPLRKDFDMDPEKNKTPMSDDPEPDYTLEYSLDAEGKLVVLPTALVSSESATTSVGRDNHDGCTADQGLREEVQGCLRFEWFRSHR